MFFRALRGGEPVTDPYGAQGSSGGPKRPKILVAGSCLVLLPDQNWGTKTGYLDEEGR